MEYNWKNWLKKLLLAAVTAGLLGFLLFCALLFLALSGCPPYLQQALWVFGPACLLTLVLAILLPKKHRKKLALCLLAAAVGCGAYVGHGLWRDSIPTVDDRDLLLWQYEPFTSDTKAASLDEPSALAFSEDALLRLDGATALYPLYAATEDGCGLVTCSGTVGAYQRLIQGDADVIFAAAPSQEQLDMAAQAGVELHLTPIGREAFVFFVNSKNPVEGLTVEEIQGIYTGQITNWSQVGGKSQSIRPFQRQENSGSQSALLRLMEGLPLIEPEQEDRISGMGGIIRDVADYRNYSNAIGFSFRFYASEMEANDQIRLLALDGVPPAKETIRDGSYPISDSFYAVTAASTGQPDPRESDPQLDAFLRWILSEQGQRIIEDSGYVGIS